MEETPSAWTENTLHIKNYQTKSLRARSSARPKEKVPLLETKK
jgi:hypothetical protein